MRRDAPLLVVVRDVERVPQRNPVAAGESRVHRNRLSSSPVAALAGLKSAARAAIVMPGVFALADKVIAQPQTSIFAAFGSFAMLVLVEFGGPRRTRLLAYLGLAGVGAADVTLGTLCSRNARLAAGAMAVVGLPPPVSGGIRGYFAAGGTRARVTVVLAGTSPVPHA